LATRQKYSLFSTSALTAASCNDWLRELKSTDVYNFVYTRSATSLQEKSMQNAARRTFVADSLSFSRTKANEA
jgi:hypothetical protein